MLVLSRKAGEEICLGDEIVISVQQIRGGNVRIGIEAPRGLGIRRGELSPEIDFAARALSRAGEAAPAPEPPAPEAGKETDGSA